MIDLFVANVTTLKFPTNTLKINTLMVLRVGVGKVGVCVLIVNELKCFEILTCLPSTSSKKKSIS
jgi:hypothetical protein